MDDAINHLKMAAEDYRRLTTPNQFTITEAAARENERLANQFDLAAEALRQMHNRLFEEGVLAGVKSLVDSCNARRLRRASPASAPEGWKLVGLEDLIKTVLDADAALSRGDKNEALIGVRVAASFVSLIKSHVANRKILAVAPTPPVSEDRKDAERLHAILETLKMEFYIAEIDAHHPEVHAIRKLRTSLFAKLTEILKAPAMQEDKP